KTERMDSHAGPSSRYPKLLHQEYLGEWTKWFCRGSLGLCPMSVRFSRNACLGLLAIWVGIAAAPPTRPADSSPGVEIIRATVQLRNGQNRGSGTVIASVPDRTWILTAAHVVRDASALQVELHRFNFSGRITGLTEGGGWPRLVRGEVLAI